MGLSSDLDVRVNKKNKIKKNVLNYYTIYCLYLILVIDKSDINNNNLFTEHFIG